MLLFRYGCYVVLLILLFRCSYCVAVIVNNYSYSAMVVALLFFRCLFFCFYSYWYIIHAYCFIVLFIFWIDYPYDQLITTIYNYPYDYPFEIILYRVSFVLLLSVWLSIWLSIWFSIWFFRLIVISFQYSIGMFPFDCFRYVFIPFVILYSIQLFN